MDNLPPCKKCGGRHTPDRICPATLERFLASDANTPLERAQADTEEAKRLEIWHRKRPHEDR